MSSQRVREAYKARAMIHVSDRSLWATRVTISLDDPILPLHGMRDAKPGEFWGLQAVREAKPGLVLLYPANLAGAPGAFRGRQGRLSSFPGYLVATSPGPAGPLWQKIRGAPFLLCVGKRRPEGCSASTSRRRDRATSYVKILLRCCYCPIAQNSFEAMR